MAMTNQAPDEPGDAIYERYGKPFETERRGSS